MREEEGREREGGETPEKGGSGRGRIKLEGEE